MKAVRVHRFGGPEVLQVDEVPEPEPGPGEVLIRLRAAGVNPVEAYIRAGQYAALPSLPYIPGSDGAGEVAAVGEGVTRLRPGDRVYVHGAPTYAEFTVAREDAVWPLPGNLTFEQGAGIGVPYLTAYRALHFVGRARPGDWVLVHGASGGVGTAAMQLAAAAGLNVVGTAGSPEGVAYVESLGAGPAVLHDDLDQAVALTGGRGFDVILEMAAHQSLGKVLPCLARGGRAVVIGSRGSAEITPRDLMAREASVVGMMRAGGGEEELRRIHQALAPLLRSGLAAPRVGRTLPLAQAADAHRAILERGFYGKLVLTM